MFFCVVCHVSCDVNHHSRRHRRVSSFRQNECMGTVKNMETRFPWELKTNGEMFSSLVCPAQPFY